MHERFLRIREIFDAALDQSEDRRTSFIQEVCEGDSGLKAEVLGLLSAREHPAVFFDVSAQHPTNEYSVESRDLQVGQELGKYQIVTEIGRGGMGTVYAARDTRLDRTIALKTIRPSTFPEVARKRFWREARIAAGVNHPNVCQLYELGEESGILFIAMEMLDGETLSSRIAKGALPIGDAITVLLGILAALSAMHSKGILHRDLKPANIFLTAHGVKILDFGLARHTNREEVDDTVASGGITQPGFVVGTPSYMAPEQLNGGLLGPATDLFSAGAILFEMLTARLAFAGKTMAEIFHAIVYEHTPALGGSPAITQLDRVIHKALQKNYSERYQTAEKMAEELRVALLCERGEVEVQARPITRLMVLPFRILRPDADTDFLSFSLPDAIASSLSGLDSLVVRSSLVASRFSSDPIDLRAISQEAEVDAVLTGTLLRLGDQIRVNAQLLDTRSGTLLRSHISQTRLRDLFHLQDDLMRQIIESLMVSITAREHRILRHDVPATASAYEHYLRGNQLAQTREFAHLARDMYLRCIEEDSLYAPAWARLGRCYRLLGKYADDPKENYAKATEAFRRALELNADLDEAHSQYAQLQADTGHAKEGMITLVRRAAEGSKAPELFVGLVYACRFCGLSTASVAADQEARRLDSKARTSITHTWFHMGDYPRALESSFGDIGYVDALALCMMGREAEAVELLKAREQRVTPHIVAHGYIRSLLACLENRREDSFREMQSLLACGSLGPEEMFYLVRQFARLGYSEEALAVLQIAVENGYYIYSTLARDSWLDSLRSDLRFTQIVRSAERHYREAMITFRDAGGERVFTSVALDV